MKLNIAAFALAFGIWWGGGLFSATWWMMFTGAPRGVTALLESVYTGYSVTPMGSIAGLIWGFFCGLISGGILAWLYNTLADKVGASVVPQSNKLA